MSDQIIFPTGFGMKDLVAYGNTGMILLDSSADTVIKASPDGEWSEEMTRERQIYERFVQRGGHKASAWSTPRTATSEHTYHTADEGRKIRWALQIAEALDFVHESGVIHGDINGFNVLLDRRLEARLADFAGSSLDGSPLLIGVTASHEYPGPLLSVKAGIFALGSTLYEVMNESRPSAGLSDETILDSYSKGIFPETQSLGTIGTIIGKCWQGEYSDCKQVVQELKAARESVFASSPNSTRHVMYLSTKAVTAVAVIAIVAASVIKFRISRGH